MLVLSRKLNERIQIGENITITLVKVQGGVVRLGIEAPREIPVRRMELQPSPVSDAGQTPEVGCRTLASGTPLATARLPRPRPGAGLRAMVAAIRRISQEPALPLPSDAGMAG